MPRSGTPMSRAICASACGASMTATCSPCRRSVTPSVDDVGGLIERIGDDVAGHGHDLDGGTGRANRESGDHAAAQAGGGGQGQKDARDAGRLKKMEHGLILSAG